MNKIPSDVRAILDGRFGHDCLIALATVSGGMPHVRTVNAYYEDGCFYVITHARSGKMRQIRENPAAAVAGDWFSAHGIGEDLGHVLAPQNEEMLAKLRCAFAAWYDNGHTDEADENTHILRIRLTDGVLFSHGTRYALDFT